MQNVFVPKNREFLRELLSRTFATTEQAAADVCRLLREELRVDVAFASHLADDQVHFLAVDEGVVSGVRAGMVVPADPRVESHLHGIRGPVAAVGLAGTPFGEVEWPATAGLTSVAMTPLWDSDGQKTGMLAVLDRAAREFSESELALLEMLGGILSREKALDLSRGRERERAAQIEASDKRYRALVDDLGDIVVEIDALGRLTYVNAALTRLTGLSKDGLAGNDMMAHVHPDDRDAAMAHMAEVIAGGDTVRPESARESRFLAADGSIRWMSVRGRPVFDDRGSLTGFLGILHDVTERVEAEQRVRAALAEAEAARDEAQRASLAKSQFLSRMSHELRTPLNAILGFSQLLQMGELDAEDAENVEHIGRAGRHLLDLINEVLDVVRIEAGALSLSLEPVEVGEVVSESLDLVRPAASGRGIILRTPDRLSGARVVADRQRLKQVLVNLLSNAVKYNRDEGEVIVTWNPVEEPTVDGADHGLLRLAVRDTGQGIPADRLEDVFTPFERLGAEGSGIEGTGVGLSLTRTLVEALGGRIGVTSTPGEGSTFWVDLPADSARVEDPAPAAPMDGVELTRTVLYVEDNPSNITLVRRILARRPHVRLAVVQDGAEAVEAVQRLVPDLTLLDLHLPGMHGAEILSALRDSDDARLRKMPIVVVTADLSVGNERRMLEAGATSFLPKPIDVHQLLAVVDDLLSQP